MKRLYSILATALVGLGSLLIAAEPALAQKGKGYGQGGYYRRYFPPPYYYSGYYYPRYQYSYPVYPAYPPPYAGSQYPVSTAPSYQTVTVGAHDSYFAPPTIKVLPGATVRWVNYGRYEHTVTFEDGSWDAILPRGASYSVNFTRPGTYHYYCRHHTAQNMRGTIIVGDEGSVGSYQRRY